ncbi:MAG: hypothetical protein HC822_13460 [Oscillochloris sp.]|nr:hypothetical protein [Oscillochloris sp.]
MPDSALRVAELDAKDLEQIRKLEAQIGTPIVAYRPKTPYAELTAAQVRELQDLEHELGVVLLAYREDSAAA